MDWIIIPARQGSKGFPGKNRKLLYHTLDIIPEAYKARVIITTDDSKITTECLRMGLSVWCRNTSLATDDANIKDVLLDVINNHDQITKTDLICMLYLTYPSRTWEDVRQALKFFKDKYANSMLCREEITPDQFHPYRFLIDNGNGTGRQVVENDLYRRQDYPKVFSFSHFIFMSYAKEIQRLNKNLWNKNTVFFPVPHQDDIDSEKDYLNFKKRSTKWKKH